MTAEIPTTPKARPLYRTHPLERRAAELAVLSAELGSSHPVGLAIEAEPEVAAVDLRIEATGPAVDKLARVLGPDLPTRPNTWTATADGRIVWLGPDEWLVTSATATPAELEDTIARVTEPCGGAAVDVSAQRTGLRVRGTHARDLLATGCSVDLHPTAFPAGSSAQTTVGQAGVLLLGLGDGDDFRLFVRPSFADYLVDWLLDAAVEFRDRHAPEPPTGRP